MVLLVAGVVDAGEAFSGFSNSAPADRRGALRRRGGGRPHARARDASSRGCRRASRPPASPASGRRSPASSCPRPRRRPSSTTRRSSPWRSPPVLSWCRRTGRSPSRFLMPVSFAAVVGGTVTLIGTSTNLVVSGLMEDAGQEPMGLFEIGAVGLPFAVISVIVMIARHAPAAARAPRARARASTRTPASSPSRWRSTAEARDRGPQRRRGRPAQPPGRLPGGGRAPDGHRISSVRPDEVLAAGDRLTFAGNVDPDPRPAGDARARLGRRSATSAAVGLGDRAPPLRGRDRARARRWWAAPCSEAGFRGRYGGAVIAIHRADERVEGKLGEVRLRPGDVLLVLAGPGLPPAGARPARLPADRARSAATARRARRRRPVVGLVIVGAAGRSSGTGVLDILPGRPPGGLRGRRAAGAHARPRPATRWTST